MGMGNIVDNFGESASDTVRMSIKLGYLIVAIGLIIYGFYRSSRKEEDTGFIG
jgi:hypothetical protein